MSKILQILKQKFLQTCPSFLKIFHFLSPNSTSSLPGITCQLSQLLRQQPQHHLPCGRPSLHPRPVLTLTELFGGAVGVNFQSDHVAGVEVPPTIVKAAVARLALGWWDGMMGMLTMMGWALAAFSDRGYKGQLRRKWRQPAPDFPQNDTPQNHVSSKPGAIEVLPLLSPITAPW